MDSFREGVEILREGDGRTDGVVDDKDAKEAERGVFILELVVLAAELELLLVLLLVLVLVLVLVFGFAAGVVAPNDDDDDDDDRRIFGTEGVPEEEDGLEPPPLS